MSSSSSFNSNINGNNTAVSTPAVIDVDCNLLHPDLHRLSSTLPWHSPDDDDDDPACVLAHPSVAQSNIIGVVSPSSTIEESERSLSSLPARFENVQIKVTAGVHPYHASEVEAPYDDESKPSLALQRLTAILQQKHGITTTTSSSTDLACVGECGLDYSEGFPPRETQLPWFRAQVELARQYRLPLFLHERLAFDDVCRVLDECGGSSGSGGGRLHPHQIIVHCFTGTVEECAEYVRRGYRLSVSGFLRKQPSSGADNLVRRCLVDGVLPLDRLMIETDAPYMGFARCRDLWLSHHEQEMNNNLNAKKRKRLRNSTYPNVPSSIVMVLDAVTEAINEGRTLRGETLFTREQVARQCTDNAKEFFGFH